MKDFTDIFIEYDEQEDTMSYTEIYGFGKSGKVEIEAEVKNSWRGAMAIWMTLEKKYLPSMPRPLWADDDMEYWSRTTFMSNPDLMREIWDLAKGDKMTLHETIVLGTTFDNVLVRGRDIPRLLEAFEAFGGETSLPEQAEAIKKMVQSVSLDAIGFNQTSVNADTWANFHYNSETEKYESYDIYKDDRHWWLFDEIDNAEIKEQSK